MIHHAVLKSWLFKTELQRKNATNTGDQTTSSSGGEETKDEFLMTVGRVVTTTWMTVTTLTGIVLFTNLN